MSRKSKKKNHNLRLMSIDNKAHNEHQKEGKKKFHSKDLKKITPITTNQNILFQKYKEHKNLFLYGSAGTGKTFLSLYLALFDVLEPSSLYDKLIIIRSTVPTREVGFLPGDLEEKINIYELPYEMICDELFMWRKSYKNLKAGGYVEFLSTSFVRGTTFNNAIIVVDEMQNMTFSELDTIITRIGEDCKIMFCGDMKQTDLTKSKHDQSGMNDFFNIVKNMREFSDIEFDRRDIVRSDLVKHYIIEKEKSGK